MSDRIPNPRRPAALILFIAFVWSPAASAEDVDVATVRQTAKVFTKVAKSASPAVVFIEAEKTVVRRGIDPRELNDPFELFNDEFFERFFHHGAPRRQKRSSQGSGFITSADGYILTNNHVVGGADSLKVTLPDKRVFPARLVGADPQTDVAVIKIDSEDLPTIPLGDSSKLEVGEWVVAIGSPFGLATTVTSGIISAKGRSAGILDYEGFIQTDAAINPGNSGGPLLNLDGEVIGINTAIYSRSGGYMGIGFAIPINMAKGIYRQIVRTGKISRGYLGASFQEVTPEIADSLGITPGGVLISGVAADSPAAEVGLRTGDVVRKADGQTIVSAEGFRNIIALSGPGARLELEVLRHGKAQTMTVTLTNLDTAARSDEAYASEKLGLTVQALTFAMRQRLRQENARGVVVTEVARGSVAERVGIAPGAIISQINQDPVSSPDEFAARLENVLKTGRRLLLLVHQNGRSRAIVLQIR